MAKNKAMFKKLCNRKSQRFAALGRKLEKEVAELLEKMQESGLIESFVYNKPFSEADCQGKDFTVRLSIGDEVVERSFGVTISYKSWGDSKVKHPDVRQFCFPIGTKPETIQKRVLELFAS